MTKVSDIKRAQKASLLLKAISQLYWEATRDDKELLGLFISRVELSQDKGMCYVFFYTPEGQEFFKEKLQTLKLYKPSLRAALAKQIPGRYTPDIIFKFDAQQKKIDHLEGLFESVKEDWQDQEDDNIDNDNENIQ